MATATQQRLTLEEYLTYDDGTDATYEFVDGVLIEMPPSIRLHRRIAKFLEDCFTQEIQRLQRQWDTGRTDVGIRVQKQDGTLTVRYPDLVVFDASNLDANEVDIIDFAPELIIEIVSTGATNRRRDYEEKRHEYGARGAKRYWIIDPEHQKVTVLAWDDEGGFYEQEEYRDAQRVPCQPFDALKLSAKEILSGQFNISGSSKQ